MKAGTCIVIMLIICLLVCGCTGENPASPETKNPAFETQDIPVNTSPPAVFISATLSDRHLGTTIFTVPGVIVVSFQAKDPQDMHIALHSRTFSRCSALSAIPMTGPYNGLVALRIPRQDEFNLNITGSLPGERAVYFKAERDRKGSSLVVPLLWKRHYPYGPEKFVCPARLWCKYF